MGLRFNKNKCVLLVNAAYSFKADRLLRRLATHLQFTGIHRERNMDTASYEIWTDYNREMCLLQSSQVFISKRSIRNFFKATLLQVIQDLHIHDTICWNLINGNFKVNLKPLLHLRPPWGSVKLSVTHTINLSWEQSHHKHMGMYGGGALSMCL